MSASTVSITNPTSARRRAVEKSKPGIDLVTTDAVPPATSPSTNRVTVGDIGRDLSHSIRGETVIVKKSLPISTNGAVLPRKSTRKVPNPDPPRWQTVLRVFTKNFLLLLVLVGLVQMVYRILSKSSNGNFEISPGFEGQFAEMESVLKKTTKMMQVQVEVLDKRIEMEVGGLRKDLSAKLNDRGAEFASQLKKLDDRTENLEKFMSELKDKESGWLTKHEFHNFFEEFKNEKGIGSGGEVSLDEVRAFARETVEREIEKLAADGLGRVDYALGSGGGKVVKHSEPYIVGKGKGTWFWASGVHQDSEKMLRPSFGEPGQCFPLKGSSGFVQIKLRASIVPEAITLEHVAKSVAYDRSSAPKHCRVFGWFQGKDNTDIAVNDEKMFMLAEFIYDLEKSNAQTFNVVDLGSSGVVDMVRLDFASNHGSPSHTCIYRLRVHGHEPNSISKLSLQS